MRILRKGEDGRSTYWDILGSSGHPHRVRVDEDGLWHCSCPGADFRGNCHHIQTIKMEREWRHIMPQLAFLQPTPISEHILLEFMKMNRFILHPMIGGKRVWMCLAKRVYVGGSPMPELPSCHALSGTVLDAVLDGNTFVAQDVVYFRGDDYRQVPLRDRIIRLGEAVKIWGLANVEEIPIETDAVLKLGIYKWMKRQVIFKDVGSLYVQRPRSWLIAK